MSSAQTPQYIELISKLRTVRKTKRLTQKELGIRLGKPQSYISKVETCERRLDLLETAEWCLALGATLDDVLPASLKAALATHSSANSTNFSSKERGDG